MEDDELKALLAANAEATRRQFDELRSHVDESAIETRRHVDVRIEHLDSKIELVAESVLVLGEKLDRVAEDIRDEMRRGLADTQALVKFSYADLDGRVRTLEEKS